MTESPGFALPYSHSFRSNMFFKTKKARGNDTQDAPLRETARCRLRAEGPPESSPRHGVITMKRACPDFPKARLARREWDVPSVNHLPMPRRKSDA
jgi:hypothetical protein